MSGYVGLLYFVEMEFKFGMVWLMMWFYDLEWNGYMWLGYGLIIGVLKVESSVLL